jgi:uncharacterized protein (TIGR03435 family)
MRQAILCLGWVAFTCGAVSQTAPAFEAATVKPNKSSPVPGAGGRGGSLRPSGSELIGENVTLWKCIAMAYGVSEDKDYAISGPEWLKSEHYDIAAKFPANMPRDPVQMRAQAQLMFQSLLAERFQLVVHRESKIVPGYALVAVKSGAKLEAREPGPGSTQGRDGSFAAKNVSMPRFADFLARFAGRPVEDKTAVTGVFNLKLEWTPDDQSMPPPEGGERRAESRSGPSLFTALQEQLGLKLESQKVSVGIIVVDHAEKVPAAN